MNDDIEVNAKPLNAMGVVICRGCGCKWTFMGTGYCGPCLEKMNLVPPPLEL